MIGVIAIMAVVGILVVLGVRHFLPTKTTPKSTSKSARRAAAPPSSPVHDVHDEEAAASPKAARAPTEINHAFSEFDVDHSMVRTVSVHESQLPDSYFLTDFVDENATTFRPINKEDAMRSATVRPAQQMKNGRADELPPARVIGLNTMMHARKMIPARLDMSSGCILFNESDSRASQKGAY